ncbi:MAG: hypothetical protein NUW01_15895 [Gemmatimonadaceae bacterium]|nr:hypothetical protein [Gemmatimonadaceae bacterium]
MTELVPSSARTAENSINSTRAKLIGKIVLARFLERSSASILAAVKSAEDVARRNGLLDGTAPALCRRVLPDAIYDRKADSEDVFARVRVRKNLPVLVWRSVYFASEYTVDGARLAECLARAGEASETILRAVRTLLLVTTRNRIAHEVSRSLIAAQGDFLRTCEETRLAPLTERQVAREVRSHGVSAADTSRVSRLLRSTVVVLPDGTPRPLRVLCPTSRMVLGALVRDVLERERMLRARGRLKGAWDDNEIARRVWRRPGIFVSRRLVAYCRKSLGAPDARVRTRRGCYMEITMNFATLAKLERQSIFRRAPTAPGVYELRLAPGERGHTPRCADIIYVGKAKNLRRRLLAHAGGNGRNKNLAGYVRRTRVLFRYRVEKGDLKRAEEELYRQFRETYGRPPECNRMSP